MVQVKIITITWSDGAFVFFNRIYKMPDGKPENVFGFDGAYKDPEFAGKVKPIGMDRLLLTCLR